MPEGLTIAVLGNHSESYSSEAEVAWTLERLGHRVLRFQEDRDKTDEIYSKCKQARVALFLYVHTHGWRTPGKMSMRRLLKKLRSKDIKTVSFHLDIYWGLNKLDQRQDLVGEHPFWNTEYVFTADGGHQAEFAARSVNHFGCRPPWRSADAFGVRRDQNLLWTSPSWARDRTTLSIRFVDSCWTGWKRPTVIVSGGST